MLTNTETELTGTEVALVSCELGNRNRRLSRCRVTLDVETTDAYRSSYGNNRVPPRCRITFQRASDDVWQFVVTDDGGAVLCDFASDGHWIDTGTQRWHIGYLERCEEYEEERSQWQLFEIREKLADAREPMRRELNVLLWPLRIATGHLQGEFTFFMGPYGRRNWRFFRTGGKLIFRSQFGYEPTMHRFSFWEWLRWRIARLFRSDLDILEYYGRHSVPVHEVEFVLDEASGLTPERAYAADPTTSPKAKALCEAWSDPIAVNGDLYIPRIHFNHLENDDAYCLRSEIDPGSCAFGPNIPLDIRPVDLTLDPVEWLSELPPPIDAKGEAVRAVAWRIEVD